MTEEQYIKVKALGTITAAIAILKDITPDNLSEIIEEGEMEVITETLTNWQKKLFNGIEVTE